MRGRCELTAFAFVVAGWDKQHMYRMDLSGPPLQRTQGLHPRYRLYTKLGSKGASPQPALFEWGTRSYPYQQKCLPRKSGRQLMYDWKILLIPLGDKIRIQCGRNVDRSSGRHIRSRHIKSEDLNVVKRVAIAVERVSHGPIRTRTYRRTRYSKGSDRLAT